MPDPMREKDDLDVLLDSALASYADPGPVSGLEKRVLAALEDARSSPQRAVRNRWLPWAVAVPIAASVLLWIAIANLKHASPMQHQQASQAHETPAPTQVETPAKHPAGANESAGEYAVLEGHDFTGSGETRFGAGSVTGHDFSRAVRRAVSTRALAPEGCPSHSIAGTSCAPLPKLDVFPSPQPLTREEETLVAAVTAGSEAERRALLEAQNRTDAPLSIADLHIPPLAPPDAGNK